MFVKPRIIIVLLFSICIAYGQNYRSVDEIKDDWLEHTKFQKQELLSFCECDKTVNVLLNPIF